MKYFNILNLFNKNNSRSSILSAAYNILKEFVKRKDWNKYKSYYIRQQKEAKLLSYLIPSSKLRKEFRNSFIFVRFPHKIKPKFAITESPDISIVIPVYNQFKITYECLKSIAYYRPNVPFEIIIADDCSTDKTKNIEKLIPGLKVVRTTGNFGFLKNVNNAMKYAKGKYVFLMNNDMLVTENWLDSSYEYIKQKDNIGIVGSICLNFEGSVQEYGAYLDSEGYAHLNIRDTYDDLVVQESDYCSGCSILFSKSDWEKLAGFDEQFSPAYYEDTDFSYGVKYQLNKKIICNPGSKIYHYRGKTYSYAAGSISEINREKFIKKWGKYIKTNSKEEDRI